MTTAYGKEIWKEATPELETIMARWRKELNDRWSRGERVDTHICTYDEYMKYEDWLTENEIDPIYHYPSGCLFFKGVAMIPMELYEL